MHAGTRKAGRLAALPAAAPAAAELTLLVGLLERLQLLCYAQTHCLGHRTLPRAQAAAASAASAAAIASSASRSASTTHDQLHKRSKGSCHALRSHGEGLKNTASVAIGRRRSIKEWDWLLATKQALRLLFGNMHSIPLRFCSLRK